MKKLLQRQLTKILDLLIIFFAIVTAPGTALSLTRIPDIGFKPEMFLHISLTCMVIVMAFTRKKIPYNVKAVIAVVSFMAIGYGGLFSLGLSSSGRLDIVISIAMACIFFNLRTGFILAMVNMAAVAVIAYMSATGRLSFGLDYNTYNYQPKAWASAYFNYTVMGVFIVLVTGLINQQLRKNLEKVVEKSRQLHTEVLQRKRAEAMYKELSVKDPLTDLYNRRYFFEKSAEELSRSERYTRALSIISIDADHFKEVNDTYGHQAGDYVLQELTERIKNCLRPSDVACRLGGEEFSIILPETSLSESIKVAERLQETITAEPMVHGEISIALTCSFGISEKHDGESDIYSILNRADKALYKAKNKGRNSIVTEKEI